MKLMKTALAGFLSAVCLLGPLSGCGQMDSPAPTETPEAESPLETLVGTPAETPEATETLEVGVATDYPAAVMVKGTLYYLSGESELEGRCGVMDGTITSTVGDGMPTENNQSNFGAGYNYQYGAENTIEVYFPEEETWMVFACDPDAPDGWGIQLTAKEATSTGLTLVCTQSGGHLTGSPQTGSEFWVEQQTAESWESLGYQVDVSWTAEAWIIPLEDTTEWAVDWTDVYGELPAGTYRIAKNIMDFRDTGDWDNKTYYAEFTLGGD